MPVVLMEEGRQLSQEKTLKHMNTVKLTNFYLQRHYFAI